MFLQPKRLKFKKFRKGKVSKLKYKSNRLNYGSIGLKSVEAGMISARQLESSRQAIMRKIKRKGKFWMRIYPSVPVTKKPIEVRMGKGKGSVDHYSAKVSGGVVLFELYGVNKSTAISAFRTGGAKLPIKTRIIY
jgi:large subunit ribosomal protein L16